MRYDIGLAEEMERVLREGSTDMQLLSRILASEAHEWYLTEEESIEVELHVVE